MGKTSLPSRRIYIDSSSSKTAQSDFLPENTVQKMNGNNVTVKKPDHCLS